MTAAKKLVFTVVVHDKAGDAHVFGPDSEEIPGWARDQISNPKAWGGEAPAAPRTAAEAVTPPADPGTPTGASTGGSDDTGSAPAAKKTAAKKATPAKKTAAKKATAKKAASSS